MVGRMPRGVPGRERLPLAAPFRLQVDGRAQAAVHIERDRVVLVDDGPIALPAFQRKRAAKPEVNGASCANLLPSKPHVTVRNRKVSAHFDLEVVVGKLHRASPCVEPLLRFVHIGPVQQRRREAEDGRVYRMFGDDRGCVLIVMRTADSFGDGEDGAPVACDWFLQRCGCHGDSPWIGVG